MRYSNNELHTKQQSKMCCDSIIIDQSSYRNV